MTAPTALPTWKRQLPLAVAIAIVAAGLLVMVVISGTPGYRIGLCVVAAALEVAAVMRALLPARRIGLLAVRSRPFDVVLLAGCGAAIVVLALTLPPGA